MVGRPSLFMGTLLGISEVQSMNDEDLKKLMETDEAMKAKIKQIQQQCAEQGEYNVTPEEIIDSLRAADEIARKKFGMTLQEIMDISVNSTIPPPPYDCAFETEEEAKEFAKKAEQVHGVVLSVMKKAERRYIIV